MSQEIGMPVLSKTKKDLQDTLNELEQESMRVYQDFFGKRLPNTEKSQFSVHDFLRFLLRHQDDSNDKSSE